MHRRISIWLFGIGIGIVLIASTLIVRSPIQANAVGCTNPNTEYECALAKQTQMVIEDTSNAQTAYAIPTFTPIPTSIVPINTTTPAPVPTVVIRQLVGEQLSGIQFRDTTSAWLVGAIQSVDPYEHIGIYVILRPPGDGFLAAIAYTFNGVSISKADHEHIPPFGSPRVILARSRSQV